MSDLDMFKYTRDMTRLRSSSSDYKIAIRPYKRFRESNVLHFLKFRVWLCSLSSHWRLPVPVPPEVACDGAAVGEAGHLQPWPPPDLAVEDRPGIVTQAEPLASLHMSVSGDLGPQCPLYGDLGI